MGAGATRACPPVVWRGRGEAAIRRDCRGGKGPSMDERERVLDEVYELALQNDVSYFG